MSQILSVLHFIGIMMLVLLVFNFVILVHEWGHFLAARWRGLKVEKFQIWMGKPIWKRTYNGVQYGLGCVPMGGFVALPQMAPMQAIEGSCDDSKEPLPPIKPIDKIIVAFAGPLFSALLALGFACLVSHFGKPVHPAMLNTTIGRIVPGGFASKSDLRLGDRILKIDGQPITAFFGPSRSLQWAVASSPNRTLTFEVERAGAPAPLNITIDAPIGEGEEDAKWAAKSWWTRLWGRPPFRMVGVGPARDIVVKNLLPNSPAELSGLQAGDSIVSVDGQPLLDATLLFEMAQDGGGKPMALKVNRAGKTLDLTLTPVVPLRTSNRTDKEAVEFFSKPTVGIEFGMANPDAFTMEKPNPFTLIYDMAANSLSTLRALVTPSSVGVAHMSGPVGIMNVYYNIFTGDFAWNQVLLFSVMLNMGLAIFNMMPLPVLDGGHITMAVLEMIRGKAANLRVMEYLQGACVLVLLTFVLFVTLKDVGGLADRKELELKFAPTAAPGAKVTP
jgi:regulator of sigma E protease